MNHALIESLFIITAAILGGFCSSAPLGAINLWVTDAILARREARLRWFLVGVIAMDCVHATFAAWGYHAFFDEGPVARWVSVAGGAFLIIIGSLSLLRRAQARRDLPTDPKGAGRRPLNDGLLGMFMCGANPAFLMFWVFAIDQVERRASTDIQGWHLGLFLLGVALGDSLWFVVLLNVVRRGREAVKPRILASLRATIGVAFVLVGTFAVYHGFRLH